MWRDGRLLTIITPLAAGGGNVDRAEMTALEGLYHLPKLCLIFPMGKAGLWAKVSGPAPKNPQWGVPAAVARQKEPRERAKEEPPEPRAPSGQACTSHLLSSAGESCF